MDGFSMHKEKDKQQQNEKRDNFFISNNRIPNILLDYYANNNLKASDKNCSKTKEAIERCNRINSSHSSAEKSVFTCIEHFPPTFPSKHKKQSHNAIQDYCLKLMEENKEEGKGNHEEKGKGSRGREGGKSRYKTELCRPFEENGSCKYAEKCQFAHGKHELRTLVRHPKYKTDLCKTYHTTGLCPYGLRCHFIHNNLERNMSQTNKLIMELAKQQSSLFNQKILVSLLNSQQVNVDVLNKIPNLANMSSFSSQQHDLLQQALASSGSSFQQQCNNHRQHARMTSRSMNSSSLSASSSSLSDSPATSPINITLSTRPSNHLLRYPSSNLHNNYRQQFLYRDEKTINDLFQEDILSAKLKSIMQAAGF